VKPVILLSQGRTLEIRKGKQFVLF
jgi:hypothetical protein